MPTITTTDVQRNFSKLLNRLSEPIVVMRDSKPEAVVIPYADYEEFLIQRRKMLSEKVKNALVGIHAKTAKVSQAELERDIKEAFHEADRD